MVGFAFTTAMASVAPWGGKETLVGNNPPSWAIPSKVVSPDEPLPIMKPPVVIVPVARLDRATLQAVAFARSISPNVKAVHIATTSESAEQFRERWRRWTRDVDVDVIESPYRSLMQPLLRYIERIDERDDRPITVVLAEFVPRNWWEWILHSQTALRLKMTLLFRPNTIVIDVPYHFRDTGHRSREETSQEP